MRPLPTTAILPRIVAGLRERGLEPVRVDEMYLDDALEWKGSLDRYRSSKRSTGSPCSRTLSSGKCTSVTLNSSHRHSLTLRYQHIHDVLFILRKRGAVVGKLHLGYFKETQTKPEGQIHFDPAIFGSHF